MLNKKDLINLIAKALEVQNTEINQSTKSDDIENWDSLGHLNILVKIDQELNGNAGGINELSEAYSVDKIYSTLKKNKLID
jgi:acyl carrier protein